MIKLALPDMGIDELNSIKEVLDSKLLVMGKEVELFETLIKQYLNVKYCFAVTSGTAALHLSLLALGIKSEDEIIVPAFTFPATANVVEIVGAKVKFVDVNMDDYCIDIEQIENAINENTKAIIIVHEFGGVVDMSKIRSIASKYNLKIIEDAACALGSMDGNNYVGTLSDMGCFSLHPRKAITTGEGGLIVTNDEEYAYKIKLLRNHGIDSQSGKPQFIIPGLNYRMTNIQAAIGIVQFYKLDKIIARRIELANEYHTLLVGVKGIRIPFERANSKHTWQTFHIVLDDEIDRDEVISLLKTKDIESNYGANAVHIEPFYKFKYQVTNLNNSEKLYKQGLALPLHSGMNSDDVNRVVDELKNILSKYF